MEIHVQEPLSTQDLIRNNQNNKDTDRLPLFASNEAQDFRTRWEKIQIGFVDEPRTSVEQADQLVATVIQRLAQVFADERNKLESAWGQGGDSVSTEDLRMALRRYRSLFDRLLTV
jgi:hypothetical protein